MSENPENLLREARRLQQEGQVDQAREAVLAALRIDRANPIAWQMAAMLTDDEREKCEALRRALGLSPDNAQLRELYNSLGCEGKITKRATQTVRSADVARPDNAISSMMMALLFVTLVIVVIGAGVAFLALDSDSDEPRRPSDDEIQGAVVEWLVSQGAESPINPASLEDVIVEEAQYCEPTNEERDEGITEKWVVDVDYAAFEGASLAPDGTEIPYTWTVYGISGDWFIDSSAGTCVFQ